jgi:hypothetical protein
MSQIPVRPPFSVAKPTLYVVPDGLAEPVDRLPRRS